MADDLLRQAEAQAARVAARRPEPTPAEAHACLALLGVAPAAAEAAARVAQSATDGGGGRSALAREVEVAEGIETIVRALGAATDAAGAGSGNALRWLTSVLDEGVLRSKWQPPSTAATLRSLLTDLAGGDGSESKEAASQDRGPPLPAPELCAVAVAAVASSPECTPALLKQLLEQSVLRALGAAMVQMGDCAPSGLACAVLTSIFAAVQGMCARGGERAAEAMRARKYVRVIVGAMTSWLSVPSVAGAAAGGGGLDGLLQAGSDALARLHGYSAASIDQTAEASFDPPRAPGSLEVKKQLLDPAVAALMKQCRAHPRGRRVRLSPSFDAAVDFANVSGGVGVRRAAGSGGSAGGAGGAAEAKGSEDTGAAETGGAFAGAGGAQPTSAAAGRMPKAAKRCSYCAKAGTSLSNCSRCGVELYCSRECQSEHWEKHKGGCLPRAKVRALLDAASAAASVAMEKPDAAGGVPTDEASSALEKLFSMVKKRAATNAGGVVRVLVAAGAPQVFVLCIACGWGGDKVYMHAGSLLGIAATDAAVRARLRADGVTRILEERMAEMAEMQSKDAEDAEGGDSTAEATTTAQQSASSIIGERAREVLRHLLDSLVATNHPDFLAAGEARRRASPTATE